MEIIAARRLYEDTNHGLVLCGVVVNYNEDGEERVYGGVGVKRERDEGHQDGGYITRFLKESVSSWKRHRAGLGAFVFILSGARLIDEKWSYMEFFFCAADLPVSSTDNRSCTVSATTSRPLLDR